MACRSMCRAAHLSSCLQSLSVQIVCGGWLHGRHVAVVHRAAALAEVVVVAHRRAHARHDGEELRLSLGVSLFGHLPNTPCISRRSQKPSRSPTSRQPFQISPCTALAELRSSASRSTTIGNQRKLQPAQPRTISPKTSRLRSAVACASRFASGF